MLTPECPEWLSELAKEEWANIVPKMEKVPGWLTQVNQATLAGHCQWYAVWKEAEMTLQKEGRWYEVVTEVDPQTQEATIVKKLHPAVRVSKEAWTSMMKCDIELGITPARGSSVQLPAGDQHDEQGLDKPGRAG